MSDTLKHWQDRFQSKRQQTPWREFVREVCSWLPMNLHRNGGLVSRFPANERFGPVMDAVAYDEVRGEDVLTDVEAEGGLFEVMRRLCQKLPFPATYQHAGSQNAEYADEVIGSANAYLSFAIVDECESICYSQQVVGHCQDIFASAWVSDHSDSVYQSRLVEQSYAVFFSQQIVNSSDIWFSSNLVGCKHCIGCYNLENASYCIQNKQLTKEEYETKAKALLSHKQKFFSLYEQVLSKQVPTFQSERVSGRFMMLCQDVEQGYFLQRVHGGKNLVSIGGGEMHSMYDCIGCGSHCTDFYAMQGSGSHGEHNYCSCMSENNFNIYYCMGLENCSYCVGCVGLRNKQYCIFNKQYTKDEWHQKVDALFTQMEQDGTLGQFFPGSMNPFYFNDTAAYLIDESFSKEEVSAGEYLWRDAPISVDIPAGAMVVKTSELDQYEGFDEDGKRSIDPAILKAVIVDEYGDIYRIIPMEYEFLKKRGLPLPRQHWLKRIKMNFRLS